MGGNSRKFAAAGPSGDATLNKSVVQGFHGEEVPEDEYVRRMKVVSPEGLPPPESTRRVEFGVFLTLLIVGAAVVIAAIYLTGGVVAALAASALLILYGLIGGVSRLCSDALREKERMKAIKESVDEHPEFDRSEEGYDIVVVQRGARPVSGPEDDD